MIRQVSRLLGVCVLLGLGAACSGGARAREPFTLRVQLETHSYQLANGLRVILCPDSTAALTAVRVRYDAGSWAEPADAHGLAHFVEHLTFMATKHSQGQELLELMRRAGAEDANGTTDFDTTSYYGTYPPERLGDALWIESERMAFALPDDLPSALFERERNVVHAEERVRTVEQPYGNLWSAAATRAFPDGHPYAHPVGGTPESVARFTWAQAQAFYRRAYAPNRATLVVSGRFDERGAKIHISNYFGALPPGSRFGWPLDPPTPQGTRTIELRGNVPRPEVAVAWHTPTNGSQEATDVALVVPIMIATVLRQSGQDQDHPVVQIQRRSTPRAQGGVVGFIATGRPDISVVELQRFVLRAVADAAPNGTDLSVRRQEALLEILDDIESPASRAKRIALDDLLFAAPSYVQERVAALMRSSTESLGQAHRRMIAGPAVVVRFSRATSATAAGEEVAAQ